MAHRRGTAVVAPKLLKAYFGAHPQEVVKEYLDTNMMKNECRKAAEFIKEDKTEPWHKTVKWMDEEQILTHIFDDHHMATFAVDGPDGESDSEIQSEREHARRIIEQGRGSARIIDHGYD